MNGQISGSGLASVVCVHGWACEGGQFHEMSGALEREFRIYCPDLPGHGGTPLEGFVPGFEAYADAVANFIRDHKLIRPVLLGHSMGGVLALMASRRLEVRAVINLDGSMPAAAHSLAGQNAIRDWLDLPDFRERLARALREGFFLPHERDARCEAIIHTMCSAPEAVLRFLPEQVHYLNTEAILAGVKAPVLYIGAAKPRFDVVCSRAMLPQLRCEQISEGGHFLHVYQCARVVDIVREFLRSCRD